MQELEGKGKERRGAATSEKHGVRQKQRSNNKEQQISTIDVESVVQTLTNQSANCLIKRETRKGRYRGEARGSGKGSRDRGGNTCSCSPRPHHPRRTCAKLP